MSGYAPPSGPPPPRVPEGWKAVWNEQYSEWFYVNLQTKQSQWELPTAPAYAAPGDAPPPGGPPGYDHSSAVDTGPEKGNGAVYGQDAGAGGSSSQVDEDEKLARQLQAEEQNRATSSGAADSFYNQSPSAQGQKAYDSQALPARDDKKRGLFGKLSSKLGGSSSKPSYGAGGYPSQGPYPQQGGYPQQYPPQQAYGYGQPYGGGYGGGYGPPPGGYYQQPQRRHGGLGAGGGAALGLGGGLLGGLLIGDAIGDSNQQAYDQGYDQGQDDGGGGGGDDGGGGDMGGGDF